MKTREKLSILENLDGRPWASLEDLEICYREILLRKPDQTGMDHYKQRVNAGITRQALVGLFVNSDEFQLLDDVHRISMMSAWSSMQARLPESASEIDWFHSIPMPDGTVTNGKRQLDVLQREANSIFQFDVNGKSILDIGAWDGYFSFEAERRGASKILSTDHYCWSGPGWGTKQGYDFAHRAINSDARSEDIDLFDLDPKILGNFDAVHFLGVLYHLKDPYGGLERAAAMAKDLLIIETVTSCNHTKKPVMHHFSNDELDDDPTNFFAPNVLCLKSMLHELGFQRIDVKRNPGIPVRIPLFRKLFDLKNGYLDQDRHIVHAWRGDRWD